MKARWITWGGILLILAVSWGCSTEDIQAPDKASRAGDGTVALVAPVGPVSRIPVAKDTSVRADLGLRRNDNYGADPRLMVGSSREGGDLPGDGADAMRILLSFPLPPTAAASRATPREVAEAVLRMRIARVRNGSDQLFRLDVHRLVASGDRTPWEEGNGSEYIAAGSDGPFGWTDVDRAHGVAWLGAGDGGDQNNRTQPDFDPEPVATVYLDQESMGPGTVVEWDVTELVNGWLAGDYPNEGIVIRDPLDTGAFKELWFHSREAELTGGARLGPELILRWGQPEADRH